MKKQILLGVAAIAMVATTTANAGPEEEMLVGGLIGGVIGNRVAQHDREVGTVIGAITGAAIGYAIGNNNDSYSGGRSVHYQPDRYYYSEPVPKHGYYVDKPRHGKHAHKHGKSVYKHKHGKYVQKHNHGKSAQKHNRGKYVEKYVYREHDRWATGNRKQRDDVSNDWHNGRKGDRLYAFEDDRKHQHGRKGSHRDL